MHTLIRMVPLRRLLLEQLPALGASFIIAEVLYKFGSFTLECLAFLATWYVADAAIQLFARGLTAPSAQPEPGR